MERRQLDLHEGDYIHTHFRIAMKEMKEKQSESNVSKDAQLLQANHRIQYLEQLSVDKDLEITSVKKEIKRLTAALSFALVSTGRLDWKIKEVQQKIHNKEGTYSDPFYVGLYKCQGNIYWDLDNLGKVFVL